MKLSIIIPSFKRPELLNWGLYSLSKQIITYPYEIIVLNDGIEDDTEKVCNKYINDYKLPIKYVFTGQRNLEGKTIWRTPGIVINQGVKMSKGKTIILTSPEIYLLDQCIQSMVNPTSSNKKILTITQGFNDTKGLFLNHIKETKGNCQGYKNFNTLEKLDTQMPFFMAVDRQKFLSIGGYDENFTGFAFDDADLIERLRIVGCRYETLPSRVVHLYHQRKTREGMTNAEKMKKWHYNKKLHEDKSKVKKDIRISEEIKTTIKKNPNIPEINIGDKNKWHLEKIPKIAHFYWGEEKLPFLRYLTILSFYKHNPEWEIRFYYPKYRTKGKSWKSKEHKFKFRGQDYYKELKKLPIKFIEVDFELINFRNDISEIYKANYLEYFILSSVGGLFSDTDILYFESVNLMSINNKKNKMADNVFSILYHGHTMGFLLSSPNNEIYRQFLIKTPEYFERLKTNYQSIGTLMINREIGETIEEIQLKFPELNILNLMPKTIYAYDTRVIKELFSSNYIQRFEDYSIGIHWYGGHKLSMKYLNKCNNFKKIENTLINKIIQNFLEKEKFTINYSEDLTIHCVVRNEPFIYYAIKSVYPYAKKILLYDTGSYDEHTLEDIQILLKEDIDKKIIFKQIPIEIDETKWSMDNLKDFVKNSKGKFGVGRVRQIQIDDTKTEFFMVVDGDEVHYKRTMKTIANEIIPNFPSDIYLVRTPINWFYDLTHIFTGRYSYPFSGGIYRTDKVAMNDISPNEHHLIIETGEILCKSEYKINYKGAVTPYAHFETYLKPFRKKHLIKQSQINVFKGELPEVMSKYPYYLKRYLKEKRKKK